MFGIRALKIRCRADGQGTIEPAAWPIPLGAAEPIRDRAAQGRQKLQNCLPSP